MKLKEKAMVKALLMHFHQDQSLLRFLPREHAKEIEALGIPQSLNFSTILNPKKWISTVHYSWFYPILKPLPQETQEHLLQLFGSTQVKGLSAMLGVPLAEERLSPFSLLYLSHYLRKKIEREEVLPLEILPKSAMNPLIKVKWSDLILIIDLLGLHDLACDLKQIVDKKLLDRMYAAIPREHRPFLEHASKQPIKWVSPKLGLSGWDGEAKKLQAILHKRGLVRLTRGIIDENLSFRWHLMHRFDVGRAKIMKRALGEPFDRTLISYFKSQILDIGKTVTK
ncbi:MAG: hypothetical protein ACKVOH_06005 [Chlamydiales bacterium]